ncbi:class I SAM-dependent methyltransferase [Agromyces marinus]|uniref:16S RNA G1207 methylase RsmC n=1 Tax=Agromyces marinus TaxID=1389020 RepID=A0ABM8H2C5_9MICO|nr:methyltransferase [Agromyces marinus]UIP59953.1 Ribosomal RNA large subunit methyltransferase G [Agromyces marinus]BDZ54943.1 16S RNA G1207 methylase RsmC [Agromyces marinus]
MDFDALRRHPDLEAPGLAAADAADRLILDESVRALAEAPAAAGSVAVIDDAYGALALGATLAGARAVRVHQDPITGERALAANADRLGIPVEDRPRSLPLEPELIAGAELVLMRLPRSLDRLDEVAGLVARHAAADVRVVAGGRIKHMTLQMNDVLGAWFDRVDVSHARQKSRLLVATGPRPERMPPAEAWPRERRDPGLDLVVVAHGGVFAGTAIDIGTRFLLDVLAGAVPDARSAVDLACGSGVVAARLARERPGLVVRASDRSAAAAASARLTARANGVAERVEVARADGLEHLPDASERLVVLNPPFHSDAAVHTGIAAHLFAEAARVLEPGGELWCVWNSHLRYRGLLERIIGPTRQIARNPKFTVTASVR